jgi:hypothetical protein
MHASSNLSAWLSSARKKKIESFLSLVVVVVFVIAVSTSGAVRSICYVTGCQNIRKNMMLCLLKCWVKLSPASDAQKTHPKKW